MEIGRLMFWKKRGGSAAGRIWQIDAARGAAILLMVFFHLLVDLHDFFGIDGAAYYEAPWYYVGKASAILFMLVSGISCRFSKNNVKRGFKVFAAGMLITAATFAYAPTRPVYIRFGILHFLGAAMILTGLLEKLPLRDGGRLLLWRAAAVMSLGAGYAFSRVRVASPFLFPLGLVTDAFRSYDYYPIFPWIGVFFAGMAIGGIVLKNRGKLLSYKPGRIAGALSGLGRHSLLVYMLHQPVMLAALYAIFFLAGAL
jgi:uncharacterized membrane protein